MLKVIATTASGLLGLGLAAIAPSQEPGGPGEPPPPHKKGEAAKKKADAGPEGDLRRAYELIRKAQASDGDGPSREWIDRAASLYRKGVKAQEDGDHRLAHEYGAAAHDLARAVDHSRNAQLLGRPAGDLPPPPKPLGPEGADVELRRDLHHAHDRILELGDGEPDTRVYINAARDLYNDALKAAGGDSPESARELARAAEAMTHVPEHLGHAAADEPDEPAPKAGPHEPKGKARARAAHDDLPPPLPPRR